MRARARRGEAGAIEDNGKHVCAGTAGVLRMTWVMDQLCMQDRAEADKRRHLGNTMYKAGSYIGAMAQFTGMHAPPKPSGTPALGQPSTSPLPPTPHPM